MKWLLTCLAVAAVLPVPFLVAQDARTVTEPVLPPVCSSLDAQLSVSGHSLAKTDEDKLDTAQIQTALDACGKGQGVVLRTHGAANAFLSGPLELREGVTLIVDKGVTLFASRDPAVYEKTPGSCGLVNESGNGCKPLIAAQHVSGAGVMGDGVIDGRGGEKLLGKNVTWWDLAEQARSGGRQQVPRLIVTDAADNFTVYRITLKNSPNFHLVYNHGDGFTVWGLTIDTPKRGARNTDGVDPGAGSKNITITHSYIRTGDDNVAIKGGTGGVANMTVSHNHFYWGHGMSIGSETNGGVSKIRVFDLSLDGPDNGIRIKSNGSRGGLVHDIVYDDVCVGGSPNPITLDTGYTAAGTVEGNSPPTMRDITLRNVRVSGGGKISFNGYAKDYRIGANLDDVLLTDAASYTYSLHHADLVLGPGPVNLKFEGGMDSTVKGAPSNGTAASCKEKFVPFPKEYPETAADLNPVLDKTMSAIQVAANLKLDLSAALTSAISYNGLSLSAARPAGDTYMIQVAENGLGWSEPTPDGAQHAEATVAAGWYDSKGKLLGHVIREETSPRRKSRNGATFMLPVPLPGGVVRIRFVVRDAFSGHMGTIDVTKL